MSNGATVSFGQTSLTRDGFWRVPNKVLYQWGRATLMGGGGSTTITFPKAFVIACLNVQATVIASPNTGFVYSTQVETVDKTSFLLSGNRADGTGAVTAPQMEVYWMAIGY